ncbi:MAG: acetyl-CoA carboxylase biotin carboxyl carrier protein subunit, partial [Akkermansia sp.]|nr:acetyl-CoA carboxylase biotin carboxyl carrier protein subunit [Akkermansia sp.]
PVAAPAPAGAGTPVPSPLAGKVVSLDVQPGTAVKNGDKIMTLEAMKMNTDIYAPADGTVASFAVAVGDAVQEGQPLAYLA